MSVGEVLISGATKQISTALMSAMESPSKEIGNYIADKIRYLRYTSLLKIVQKAEAKAKERRMHLKMPPLKFFVPFCEAASLEDADESEDLSEIWANLLIGASERADADSLLYLRVLQQVGTREVKFLRALMEEGRATTFAMMVSSIHPEEADEFDESGLQSLFAALPEDFDLEYVADLIVDCAECPGILFDEICLLAGEGVDVGQASASFDHDMGKQRAAPANILMSLGLLEKLRIRNMVIEGWEPLLRLSISGYRVTRAGVAFYKACAASAYKKKFKRRLNYDDYDTSLRKWFKSQKAKERKHGPRHPPGWTIEMVRAIIKG